MYIISLKPSIIEATFHLRVMNRSTEPIRISEESMIRLNSASHVVNIINLMKITMYTIDEDEFQAYFNNLDKLP